VFQATANYLKVPKKKRGTRNEREKNIIERTARIKFHTAEHEVLSQKEERELPADTTKLL